MRRIEKTVFISYRRVDRWPALTVFKDLTQHGYDTFIDYDGIASGDFESAIVDNIKARAHFVVLLTPTALERCNDPSDWMRREIEIALHAKRNIVPLLMNGFTFKVPIADQRLKGSLGPLRRYQALTVPEDFFDAAMERLRNRYLAVSVDAVLHTASEHAQQIANEQRDAAARAAARATIPPSSRSRAATIPPTPAASSKTSPKHTGQVTKEAREAATQTLSEVSDCGDNAAEPSSGSKKTASPPAPSARAEAHPAGNALLSGAKERNRYWALVAGVFVVVVVALITLASREETTPSRGPAAAPTQADTPAPEAVAAPVTEQGHEGEPHDSKLTVKWFNDAKSFGFIPKDGGGE